MPSELALQRRVILLVANVLGKLVLIHYAEQAFNKVWGQIDQLKTAT
jgi:hypothetical protein